MRLLVIRTSAMGDVALTLPVLEGMRKEYPEVEILLLTRKAFAPFFKSAEGVDLFFPDFKGRHGGFSGLFKLFLDIRKLGHINYVIDLHDVLRSKVLRTFFFLSGVKVSVIDKGRGDKRAVITGKIRTSIKHSVQRYCDVFSNAGFDVQPSSGPWIIPDENSLKSTEELLKVQGRLKIGVAPYARHLLKTWPEEYMKSLLSMISGNYDVSFLFFGGKEDIQNLEALQSAVSGSQNLAGKLTLDEELAIMSRLDLMIAMDSSNMHMAALTGIKVISIWGATDPITGFGAWMQPLFHSVRIPAEELECRPCTVYGKGGCRRGDFACMNRLTPEMVFSRIKKLLR